MYELGAKGTMIEESLQESRFKVDDNLGPADWISQVTTVDHGAAARVVCLEFPTTFADSSSI